MITHVAIRSDGVLYSLPKPNRHPDVIKLIADKTGKPMGKNLQGFIDDKEGFVTRKHALTLAMEVGQILDPNSDGPRIGILFSEDIW
jgi:hypothetical protein